MRIYGITAGNYNSTNKLQRKSQTLSMQPAFKGTEYQYAGWSGSTYSGGAYCKICDKNGNIVVEGAGGMYGDSYHEAIYDALKKVNPGGSNIKIININPGAYYRDGNMGKVYVADPEEGITDEMRKKYDYIALEKRPPIPTIEQLDRKFHTMRGDETDYNTMFKDLSGYHKRLLKADLKTYNNLELKNIEDEDYLAASLKNRDRLYFEHLRFPYSQACVDDLNKESYFVSLNQQHIQENKAKMDYYNERIEDSRKKIEYTTKLEAILDKAGGLLIQRDIAAKKLEKDKEQIESAIIEHIDNSHAIKIKQAENRYNKIQLVLLEEQRTKLEKQKFIGNASAYNVWSRTASCGGLEFRDEKERLEKQIKATNNEIHELKQEQIRLGQYMAKYKPIVEADKKEVQDLIKKADVIYQELKKYYEENNPF